MIHASLFHQHHHKLLSKAYYLDTEIASNTVFSKCFVKTLLLLDMRERVDELELMEQVRCRGNTRKVIDDEKV